LRAAASRPDKAKAMVARASMKVMALFKARAQRFIGRSGIGSAEPLWRVGIWPREMFMAQVSTGSWRIPPRPATAGAMRPVPLAGVLVIPRARITP
jgi:hypothetical protein